MQKPMNEQQRAAFREAWRNIEDNEEKDYEVAESMWNKAATEVDPKLLSRETHDEIYDVIERVKKDFGGENASSITSFQKTFKPLYEVKDEDILVKDPDYKGPHISNEIDCNLNNIIINSFIINKY